MATPSTERNKELIRRYMKKIDFSGRGSECYNSSKMMCQGMLAHGLLRMSSCNFWLLWTSTSSLPCCCIVYLNLGSTWSFPAKFCWKYTPLHQSEAVCLQRDVTTMWHGWNWEVDDQCIAWLFPRIIWLKWILCPLSSHGLGLWSYLFWLICPPIMMTMIVWTSCCVVHCS